MSENEKQLAKALEVALEVTKRLLREIDEVKKSLMALQESVASGNPPLGYEDALRQGSADHSAAGHNADEALALVQRALDQVRMLAK